ncbi:E3 ubiquitin ligase PQT3-like [Linum grandiflorum]
MTTMTVKYKFLSAKDFSEIRFPGHYVSVADLKLEILNAKFKAKSGDSSSDRRHYSNWNGLCLGNDHDLLIIDSQTNTPYFDESALLTNNSSVLLRRVPGDRKRRCLDTTTIEVKEDGEPVSSSITAAAKPSTVVSQIPSSSKATTTEEIDDLDDDDFGGDVYAVPSKAVHAPPPKKSVDQDEENKKIRELVNTPALGSWSQAAALSILTSNSRGFGWDSRKRKHPFSSLPPPNGYVCHRCGIKGHFIQDCPTNGDPNYDHSKRMRASAATPSAAAESEFDRQMEGISSCKAAAPATSNSSGGGSYTVVVPPELHCPLCRRVMRDAVFVKRCCFRSFCEGCIKDRVANSKSCACGAEANVDDFVPNVTVRNMISSILQRSSCSSSGGRSSVGSNSSSTVIRT